jgi:hypothetical protein
MIQETVKKKANYIKRYNVVVMVEGRGRGRGGVQRNHRNSLENEIGSYSEPQYRLLLTHAGYS